MVTPPSNGGKETVCCLVHTGTDLSICLLVRFFCLSPWYESNEALTTNVVTPPSNGDRRQSTAWFTLALTSRYAFSSVSSVSAPGMNQTKHLQPMLLPCYQTEEGDSLLLGSHWQWPLDMPPLSFLLSKLLV